MDYMLHAVTLCLSLWIVSSKPAGYFTSSAFRVCIVRSLIEVIFGPYGTAWKRLKTVRILLNTSGMSSNIIVL